MGTSRWGFDFSSRPTPFNLLLASRIIRVSISGSYHNGSAGRGKNRDEDPIETLSWIADCRRLLDRCAKQQAKRNAAEVCQAFEIVFGLLDDIDAGHDDVVAFAD
jgi:hypothetical protein